MARKKNLPRYEEIELESLAEGGRAVARVDGMVIFVRGGAPGDIVDIQVTKKRKSYLEARIEKVRVFSSRRVEPICPHFEACGGCVWQHVSYRTQLEAKQKITEDAFARIGGLELAEFRSILPSPKTEEYRNKLEYSFAAYRWLSAEEIETLPAAGSAGSQGVDRRGLGFHAPGRFDRVVDIRECRLQREPTNLIRNRVREIAFEQDYSFYDARRQEGLLRALMVRTAETGELMVVLVLTEDDRRVIERILGALREEFPAAGSLMYIINPKVNDSLLDLEPRLFSGRDYIIERLEGLNFRIGATSFFQTNTLQAERLYRLVRQAADLKGVETVYDLYTGTGTIALSLAGAARKVVGIELVEAAIADARQNAEFNGIKNAVFLSGDMRAVLGPELFAQHGAPEVMIIDPPRAGMHEEVVETVRRSAPERIVYVSCRPSTQARDIALLSDDYQLVSLQPVDMFPHTHHVENVALLKRR